MKNTLAKKVEAAKSLLKDQNCVNCWGRFYIGAKLGSSRWCYVSEHQPKFGVCSDWCRTEYK